MAEDGKMTQEETVSLSEFQAMQSRMAELEKRDKEREAALAEAEAEKAKLSEEKATVEQEKVELSGKVDSLTETTDVLMAQAALSKKKERMNENERFMDKLRTEKGGTVAALSNTNVVHLLAYLDGLSDEHVLKLSDDKTVRLGDELRAVLSALPKFDGGTEYAPVSMTGEESCGLSQHQLHIAEQLGLIAEQFKEEREAVDRELKEAK